MAAALLVLGSAAHAQGRTDGYGQGPTFSGFLCCNMHTDGKWISDINYVENAPTIVPLGTPLRVTGYGANRVFTQMGDKPQTLGNDYSRTMTLPAFARRYIVPVDPRIALAGFTPKIRNAILAGHVTPGMTHQQVIMAIGYPITSENARLDAPTWRYWRSMSDEFQVLWVDGVVSELIAMPITRRAVYED